MTALAAQIDEDVPDALGQASVRSQAAPDAVAVNLAGTYVARCKQ